MAITIPSDVAWVLNMFGFMWPEADEDKLRASAQAWRDFSAQVVRINQDARLVAVRVTTENTGDSIDSFERYWHGVGGSGGDLDRAKEAADHMAIALDLTAGLVEGVKLAIIAQLGILAAEIIADQLLAVETFGISEGVAVGEVIVTRGIVRRLIQEGIHKFGQEIVHQVKGRVLELFRKILATAVRRAMTGATVAGGMDIAKQEADVHIFHSRRDIDFTEVAGATGTGAVLGLASAPGRSKSHSPTHDVSHLDRGDGRDPGGRFTGAGGYGKSAEAQGLVKYEETTGLKPIDQQVRVTSPDGNIRYYDGLALKPDGTYEGVEVKSGTAERDAHQREFDAGVSAATPARGMFNGKPITVTSIQVIQVDE